MRYEEPYRKNPRRARKGRKAGRRRKSFGGWLLEACLRLLALVLALALAGGGLLYALPVSLLAVEPEGVELELTDGLPQDRVNLLLLGLDQVHQSARRSDTIIIATLGAGEVKLTSVLRDAVMDIPGRGPDKLNAAYAYGGPSLVMRTLNHNLKLNLIHYVAVDYATLVRLVDALGGVDVEISAAEMEKINRDIAAKSDRWAALGYSAPPLTASGEGTHLNGLQALTYARIRKLDSDFMRSHRQRKLLGALLLRLRRSLANPLRLVRLARAALQGVDTSLSPLQLISLAEKALAAGEVRQLRLPVDGSYTDDGSSLRIDDMQMNVGELQMFLYGGEG